MSFSRYAFILAAVLALGGCFGTSSSTSSGPSAVRVTSVTSSATDGTYGPGQTIPIQVVFDQVVTVVGTPQITLETGTTDAVIDYVNGSGTLTLTFNYTVSAGQASSDLDYASASALSGGQITDASGVAADLTLPTPGGSASLAGSKAIVIDAAGPTVSSVTSSRTNGTWGIGQVIPVQIVFNEAVTVVGIPQLTLETSASDAVLSYASGSGTTTLTFNYTIATGHQSSDLDYVGVNSLTLNGGTLKDASGNDASLSLPAPGSPGSLGASKALVVDGVVPTVTGVSSSATNETYGLNQTIAIEVSFTEPVTVAGSPQLTLATGSSNTVVNFASGSGSSTLTFLYTVGCGHKSADLDAVSDTSLVPNGGTILDAGGNAATLTLPAPSASGSLGNNKNLVVRAPTCLATLTGTENDARFGFSLGGDAGFGPAFSGNILLVGEPWADAGGTDRGKVHVYGAGGTFQYTLTGSEDGALFGYSVAYLGNPGVVVVGAPNATAGGTQRGTVFVYSGSTLVATIPGTEDGARLGFAVANAGDVDGDNVQEFAIGEPFAAAGGIERGKAYLYRGSNNTLFRTLLGGADGGHAGSALAGIGDNVAALSDVLVGSPDIVASGTIEGGVWFWDASTSPVSGTGLVGGSGNPGARYGTAVAGGPPYYGAIMSGPYSPQGGTERGFVRYGWSTAVVIAGAENGARFGFSLGDLGGMLGIAGLTSKGLLVGAPWADGGGTDSGRVYIYNAATSGTAAAPVTQLQGTEAGALYGYAVVPTARATLTPFGNDASFAVSAPDASSGGTRRGAVFVYRTQAY